MIPKEITRHILTVGCNYRPVRGGIAAILKVYEDDVYDDFQFLANSNNSSKLKNLWTLCASIIRFIIILCFQIQIKVIHIHTASYNSFRRSVLFAIIAKSFGRKVIMHMHGGDFENYYKTNSKWITQQLNRCDAIIALTEYWRVYFKKITTGIPIGVVPNVVSPPCASKSLNYSDGKVHLLFLGLITQQKGIYDLIQVLKEHFTELRDRIILHIGGNGEVEYLQQLIKKQKLCDMIKYEGWLEGERKSQLLTACDVFILPSYTEGLPMSILEAMSYGKPIIATNVGGISTVVKNKGNGLIVKPGDKDMLFSGISFFVDHPDIIKEMGLESLKIIEPYSPMNVANNLSVIYKKFI